MKNHANVSGNCNSASVAPTHVFVSPRLNVTLVGSALLSAGLVTGMGAVSGSAEAQLAAETRSAPETAPSVESDAASSSCVGEACADQSHGVYISRSSGLPLFRAEDRFGGNEAELAFVRPLNRAHLAERRDAGDDNDSEAVGLFDAHSGKRLGHVAFDGTPPFGKRYLVQRHQVTWMGVGSGQHVDSGVAPAPLGRAVFASRCAWSHEGQLGKLQGVKVTSKGYHRSQTRSLAAHPQTSGGDLRCVEVIYDPAVVTYSDVANQFLKLEEARRNGAARSDRPVLFVSDTEQTRAAQALKARTGTQREGRRPARDEGNAPSAWWAEVRAAGDFESVSSLQPLSDDGACQATTPN